MRFVKCINYCDQYNNWIVWILSYLKKFSYHFKVSLSLSLLFPTLKVTLFPKCTVHHFHKATGFHPENVIVSSYDISLMNDHKNVSIGSWDWLISTHRLREWYQKVCKVPFLNGDWTMTGPPKHSIMLSRLQWSRHSHKLSPRKYYTNIFS